MDSAARQPGTRRLSEHVINRAAAYIGQVGGWSLRAHCLTAHVPSQVCTHSCGWTHWLCRAASNQAPCCPCPGCLASLHKQVLLRPSATQYASAPGEGQMAINTLRAAELLTDDSNFRGALIPLLAPTISGLLAQVWPAVLQRGLPLRWCLARHLQSVCGMAAYDCWPCGCKSGHLSPLSIVHCGPCPPPCPVQDPASFKSRWCAGPEAVAYHERDDILINSLSSYSLYTVSEHSAHMRASPCAHMQWASSQASVRVSGCLRVGWTCLLVCACVGGNLFRSPSGSCTPTPTPHAGPAVCGLQPGAAEPAQGAAAGGGEDGAAPRAGASGAAGQADSQPALLRGGEMCRTAQGGGRRGRGWDVLAGGDVLHSS